MYFLMLGLFAMGASFALFVLIPKLRSLIQEKNQSVNNESNLTVTERVALCE